MTPEESDALLNAEFGRRDNYAEDCLIRGYLDSKTPLVKSFKMQFATRIAALREASGFETFKGKLKSQDNIRFKEAMSVLEIAYKFAKSSFSVSFVPVASSRTPDVQLSISNKTINLEVTQIFESEFETEVNLLRNEIQNKITMAGICYSGVVSIPAGRYNDIRFIRDIRPEVLEQLDNNLKIVENDRHFHEFKVNDILDFAVAPQVSRTDTKCIDSELLTKWIEKKNGELGGEIKLSAGRIIYYSPRKDPIQKVKDNIKEEKINQLCFNDNAGIMVMVNKYDHLLVSFYTDDNVKYFMGVLQKHINNNPKITALIFYNQFGGMGSDRIIKDGFNLFVCKPFNLSPKTIHMVEDSVVIFNRNAVEKLGEEVVRKIAAAFEEY